MNLDHVRNLAFEPIRQHYDFRDSALYALSLGMGEDPLDEDELPYVYEGRGALAVPSQCVTLCWAPFWHREPAAGIAWQRVLHGEQTFTVHRPLSSHGAVVGEHKIIAVEDKGASRGALVHTAAVIKDAQSGEPLVSLRSTEFLRDDGGCGGFGSPPSGTSALNTEANPTDTIAYRTGTQAALLYRQASRDYMPIHADPDVARQAGFPRPISHGLNTLGLACRAALKRFAPGRPEKIKAMSVRFVGPAFPGDTIQVEFFETSAGIRFRAQAVERGALVLDRGEVTLG